MTAPTRPMLPSELGAELIQAWREHDVELALRLIQADAPNAPAEPGVVPLCNAIRLLEPERALSLIPWRVDEVDVKRMSRSPLGYACELSHDHRGPEMTRALLLAGADPNVLDAGGSTPLTRASERAFISTMRLLLDHGADPNLGSPLASIAVGHHVPGFLDAAWLLLERGASPDDAARFGYSARSCVDAFGAAEPGDKALRALRILFLSFEERRVLKAAGLPETDRSAGAIQRL